LAQTTGIASDLVPAVLLDHHERAETSTTGEYWRRRRRR
jgi:hypothetical protein